MSVRQGRVALMLCESIRHALVEAGIISKTKAIETIEGVAELTREGPVGSNPATAQRIATELVEPIARALR